jgi:glyoxylase-like metal-dependent hydrolase (beta-lactamase superfamily II)
MARATFLALSLAAVLSGCAQPTPEQQIILDATAALGGDRVARAKTLAIEAEGTHFNLGQDVTPEAMSQTFSVTAYKRALDWGSGQARLRVEQTRTPNFAYFQGQAPQTQIFGVDGNVGYTVPANGKATRTSDAVARDRRADFYHHPVTIVRAALLPGTRLANARSEGQERLVDITTSDSVDLTLAVNATDARPTRVTSRTYHTNLGDVVIETRFAEYRDADGLRLPSRLTTMTDGVMTADLRVTKHTLDADVGDLTAPASAAAGPVTAPPAPTVSVEEVARGIWLLAGQSHHSALVEFSDHLMLIEAPQSEARTLAVIAKARELRPGKPLTAVVNSHHHFDHSAGIRAAVSEGLTIITHSGNAAFMQDIVKRPHTRVPDALAKKPAALKLQTVDDALTLEDAAMSVTLYAITDNPHSETMLMAYFPKHRVLVEVDAFSPGSAVHPYAANLLENVSQRKLRVDRVVPLHGTIAPYAELVKAAASTSN